MSSRTSSTTYAIKFPTLCLPPQKLHCSGCEGNLHHQLIHICVSCSFLHHTMVNLLGIEERRTIKDYGLYQALLLMLTHFSLSFHSYRYQMLAVFLPLLLKIQVLGIKTPWEKLWFTLDSCFFWHVYLTKLLEHTINKTRCVWIISIA